LRLLLDPGWAVWAVALAFLLLVPNGVADRFDYLFHTAGGAAIAFFAYRTVSVTQDFAARIKSPSRPLFALVCALVAAALWEAAEFVADRTLRTQMQHDLLESLRDIAFGALGALAVCVVVWKSTRRPVDQK
jgi:hypothetical protein